MRTPQQAIPGVAGLAMGLSWFVQNVGSVQLVMHDGDTFGQHTTFVMVPEQNFALVLLTNAQPGGAFAEPAILATAAQQYLGLDDASARAGMVAVLLAPGNPTRVSLSPDELGAFAGRYADLATAVSLRVANGTLRLNMERLSLRDQVRPEIDLPLPNDVAVQIVGTDLLAAGPFQMPVVHTADGAVAWLGLGLRLIPRVGPA
jgi:hypothetical protein